MTSENATKVVIAGGGTAGWLAAFALSGRLGSLLDITLVESDAIGTIGVGEASIPPMRTFHKLMGVDEQEFMRATQATFKLGIVFENWAAQGDRYVHSFGKIGTESWMAEFHEFWLEAQAQGFGGDLGDYCLELKAAEAGKFAALEDPRLNYAFHLDATAYAQYLRGYSEKAGVKRIEGKILEVGQDTSSGFIESVMLDSGQKIHGDFFIDCTGFRALLIGQALQVGYQDWSHWLAADSALAVQTAPVKPPPPYTRSIAHESSWQWQIPLQKRVGNGLVYSSYFLSDEAAEATLLSNLEGELLTEPKSIKYHTGMRNQAWCKNCVAFGLSSGFVEPLESTSIHLIMTGIIRLIKLFPFSGSKPDLAKRYNDETRLELESIRDFIILHYHATQRTDSGYWNYYRTMEIPDSLRHRMSIFEESGYASPDDVSLFRVDSWVQVMFGQRLFPKTHHHAGRLLKPEALRESLSQLKASIDKTVSSLPAHSDFIKHYCGVSDEMPLTEGKIS